MRSFMNATVFRCRERTIFDEIDADLGFWCVLHQCRDKYYAKFAIGKHRLEYAHRLVMERVLGRRLRADEFVDHIDRNSLNNSRSNLRLATFSQNRANCEKLRRKKEVSSAYRGVSWKKRMQVWEAVTAKDGIRHFLGHFENEVEAARAYDRAVILLHGDFANPNFPKQEYVP